VSRWRRFCFLLGRRHDLFGIEVRVLLADRAELEIVLVKLREAFDLLRTHDSRRFAQLRKGVRYIWVGATHNTAEYWVDLNMCVLQFDYVLSAKTSAADLAQTLVHEAMHARLHRLGFGYEEHERDRIERICVRAEIDFVERLSGEASLVADAERRLAYGADVWTDSEFNNRGQRALRGLGWAGRLGYLIGRTLRWLDRGRAA
jgi:hypothetical protein